MRPLCITPKTRPFSLIPDDLSAFTHARTTIDSMRLLEALTSAFINTFGITQPTEKTRRRASWFILSLLVVALIVVCAIGSIFYHLMHL